MPRDHDERIIGALRELPFAKRLGLLAMAVIAAGNGGVTAPICGLLVVASAMARELTIEQRFQLAEVMRDHADALEREPVHVD